MRQGQPALFVQMLGLQPDQQGLLVGQGGLALHVAAQRRGQLRVLPRALQGRRHGERIAAAAGGDEAVRLFRLLGPQQPFEDSLGHAPSEMTP